MDRTDHAGYAGKPLDHDDVYGHENGDDVYEEETDEDVKRRTP